MPELIVIGGSPGTGKSTLAAALHAHLRGPWIDYGRLREFHLERDWSNQGPEEEAMTFENLIAIIRNYLRHGYFNIIVDDLRDHRIQQISSVLADVQVQVLTLVMHDPDELCRRIRSRNDGWKNTEAAVAWNQQVIERAAVKGEHKIDVTIKTPPQVVDEALKILGIPGATVTAITGATRRPATEVDLELIYRIRRVSLGPYIEQTYGQWDEAAERKRFNEVTQVADHSIVELDGEPVGYLAFKQYDTEIRLARLFILPQFQRRGLGTRILKEVLTLADERHLPVRLRVLRVNPARRLYERHGFLVVGEDETHYMMVRSA